MKRTGLLLLLALLGPGCADKTPPREATVALQVTGMHCENCAIGITETLAHQKGVLRSDVHFSNAVQTVVYDANRLSEAQVIAVITNRGFTARPPASTTPQ